MSLRVPTERMLRLMAPADRAPLGKAGVTAAEADTRCQARMEKELQNHMVNELRRRRIFFSRPRMDKRPTCRVGMFDFSIVLPGGRHLAVEAKMPGGLISADQKRVFDDYFDQTGQIVHLILTFDQFRHLLDAASTVGTTSTSSHI